ncbi:MAG: type 1 periplasmic binding fold superfamily protein [Flavobacteriales bacterium]
MTPKTQSTMNTTLKYTILLLSSTLALLSCKKDEGDTVEPPPPTNEEEVITTLVLTFVDAENVANVYELRFSDPDGDGGAAPAITTDTLPAGRAYSVSVSVLNESASPVDNITSEIQAEDEMHQFFYQVTGANLTMAYADADANGMPVGLLNTAITGLASAGTLKVTLRHQPDKSAANVSAGDITNAGGDTDIEVTFPVAIE